MSKQTLLQILLFIFLLSNCHQFIEGKWFGKEEKNTWQTFVEIIQNGKDFVINSYNNLQVSFMKNCHHVLNFIRNLSLRVLVDKILNIVMQIYHAIISYLVSFFDYLYSNHIRKYHQIDRKNEKNVEYYYWIAYCTLIISIILTILILILYNTFKILKRKYDLRREEKTKEEKLRQQRITTLYEILVSERQYCEYLRFLHDQYYLPLEKGDSSRQIELTNLNLIQTIKEKVTEMNQEENRDIVDFEKVHNYKRPECLLVPSELENILLLNNRFLRSLESEILGWHTKDRLMYNIYRYSVKFIGDIFRKSNVEDESITEKDPSTATTDMAPQTPTILTKKPLPSIPGVTENIDNFGYNIKSVKENCNILEKCFKEYMQAFIIYAMFICKYNECRTNINELSKEFPYFSDQLKKARSLRGANSLDLMSFIVMIPQRLPRYALFLKQLGKFTNLNNPQFKEIETAIKEIEKITSKVNSYIKEYQNQTMVITVKDTIINNVPSFKSMEIDLVQPHRRSVGSFKVNPIRSKEDLQGEDSQTPRTQLQTVEIHVFTDLTIVITSKPRLLPIKTKEEKGFFGFFTPRNKDKRNSLQSDPTVEEMIYEVYYCENSEISMFSQSADCLILELNKSKYFTNTVEEKSQKEKEKKEKKNTTPNKSISKLIHLDKKDEHTVNFIRTFEKLSGQKTAEFSVAEEGLMSNSKLLTFMASYINNN